MTAFLKVVGTFVVLIVVGILFYLGREARFAFDQNFPYGFKVVASGKPFPADHDIETDVNATVLSANPDGLDELDEKDEGVPMPMIADLDMDPATSVGAATGTYHGETTDPIDPLFLFRDNYRAQKKAEVGGKFTFYVFGTPAQTGDKIYLKYAPDNSFEPTISPYKFRLKMVKAPDGVNAPPVDIVLGRDFKGVIELPAWQAKTDEDRTRGYVFELEAIPQMSTVAATFRNMLQTNWNPTIAYPQFGIIPLVLASVMVTLMSVLIATPLSIALAVYISEVAPQATKTRLKTLIELLSSVPTVVLGYFGILIMGPLLMGALGQFFRVDSGRMLLTCAVMMGILLIPTIANLIEDTLSNLPDHFRDGADALGLTQSESIKQVILPAAKAGIIGAFLIGMARAFGETMLLWMLSGGTVTMLNARNGGEFFKYFVGPVKGVPDTVGIELGNVSFESTHYGHLFVIGLVLFFVTFGINTLGYSIARKGQWTR